MILRTDSSRLDVTLLRAVLAIVMWPHGAQKVLGWFGGHGLSGTLTYFTDTLGMPWWLGALVIVIEFVGPLLLLVGAGARVVGVAYIAVMVGAVTVGGHLQNGFFMNWSGAQAGEGYEYHLLMIGAAAVVVISGAGAWSVDAALSGRLPNARPEFGTTHAA
jgi:putative oxidoreductase